MSFLVSASRDPAAGRREIPPPAPTALLAVGGSGLMEVRVAHGDAAAPYSLPHSFVPPSFPRGWSTDWWQTPPPGDLPRRRRPEVGFSNSVKAGRVGAFVHS
jgi:hypothetical protein